MVQAPAKPRGRRPGHDDTRGTIRTAARDLFTSNGYDGTSLRAIARAADVDPALVHHYYASKAQLYCQAVLTTDVDAEACVASILDGPVERVGVRAVRLVFEGLERPGRLDCYVSHLPGGQRTTTESRSLQEFLAREVFTPVACHFGHTNAPLRGQLAASAILGVVTMRHVLAMSVLASTSNRTLSGPLGVAVQHHLVDVW